MNVLIPYKPHSMDNPLFALPLINNLTHALHTSNFLINKTTSNLAAIVPFNY
jgi:hypothetical protein